MKKEELRQRSDAELQKLLSDSREELRKARFGAKQKQLKNVRNVRSLKKTIARILTIKKEKSV